MREKKNRKNLQSLKGKKVEGEQRVHEVKDSRLFEFSNYSKFICENLIVISSWLR